VLLEQAGVEIEESWDFVGLSAFAVQFRYDAFDDMEEALDREEMLRKVEAFFGRVDKYLRDADARL
jgi:hypothetical protein